MKQKEWIGKQEEEPKGNTCSIPSMTENENGKRVGSRDYVVLSLEDFLNIVDKDKIIVLKEQKAKRKLTKKKVGYEDK